MRIGCQGGGHLRRCPSDFALIQQGIYWCGRQFHILQALRQGLREEFFRGSVAVLAVRCARRRDGVIGNGWTGRRLAAKRDCGGKQNRGNRHSSMSGERRRDRESEKRRA
jgi:hypothetical protein